MPLKPTYLHSMRSLLSHGVLPARLARVNALRPCPSRPTWLQRNQHTESRLPRIAQPSFWDSIIPRFLRRRSSKKGTPASDKPSNPATYLICIYILIGSQAIRIMSLNSEFMTYSRKADLKIQQVREVVGKLQRGEDVDVEKILGTGDETPGGICCHPADLWWWRYRRCLEAASYTDLVLSWCAG